MRLIDADALIISLAKDRSALVNNHVPYGELRRIDETIWKVAESPTISAVPVVRGEWEYEHGAWACSKCGEDNPYGIDYETVAFCKYCPNCGAKMDGKHEKL